MYKIINGRTAPNLRNRLKSIMKRNAHIISETVALIWHFPNRIKISARGALITVPLFCEIDYHTRQILHQPYGLSRD